MVFRNEWFAIFGIVGAIFWCVSFFHWLKKNDLYIPRSYQQKSFRFIRGVLFLIGLTGWGFISFSLAGPREPAGYEKSSVEVNDIFILVDVSRSMLAEDFHPNRLEVAKQKIAEFVDLKPSDRIGIIIFSEQAFTLLPLSTDLELIRQMIKEIRVGFLGSGTNIGDALGLAVGRLTQSLAENKAVILMTDGVSNVGVMTPIQAAGEAEEKDVKVYTIGIGGSQDARIPVGKNVLGRKQYQTIPGGSIDTKTLQKISSLTNGKFFLANDSQALSNTLGEIEKMEKTEVKTQSRIVYSELYLKYLLYGVGLLMLAELSRRLMTREAIV